MSGPGTWTAGELAGWVAEKFGEHAAGQQAWCDKAREHGRAVAAYECPAFGAAHLTWVPGGYEADDLLPLVIDGVAWPFTLVGVCHPEGSNIVPLSCAAVTGR